MYEKVISFIHKLYGTEEFVPLSVPKFMGNEKKYLEECIDTLFQILLLVSHKLRNTQRDKFLCSIKFMNERNYFFIHDIFL